MARKYIKVSDEQRLKLIKIQAQGKTIKEAAQDLGISYENAKAIIRVFKKDQRIAKCPVPLRVMRQTDPLPLGYGQFTDMFGIN